jgi:hypothetical protein
MRLTIGARTGLALVALVASLRALILLARPVGAQSEIHVAVYPGYYPGKVVFNDVGKDGLRLGDRLTARGTDPFPLGNGVSIIYDQDT